MSNELEKNMNAMLDGETGKIPTAFKILSMNIDKKFTDIENKIDNLKTDSNINHSELLKAIEDLKCSNNIKFDKLKVVMFFSEYPKIATITCIGLTVLIIINIVKVL